MLLYEAGESNLLKTKTSKKYASPINAHKDLKLYKCNNLLLTF